MPNTDQTIQDIYHKVVSPSSLRDRIQLAALILNDLTEKNIEVKELGNVLVHSGVFIVTLTITLPNFKS